MLPLPAFIVFYFAESFRIHAWNFKSSGRMVGIRDRTRERDKSG